MKGRLCGWKEKAHPGLLLLANGNGPFLSIKKRIQKSIINQGTSVRIIFS
ncbi:hypothetical protein WCP94_002154 [Bilophila wadsworthia]